MSPGCEPAEVHPGRVEAFLLAERRVEVAQASVNWISLEQLLAELITDRTTRPWALPLLSKGREVFLGELDAPDESFAALIERAGRASQEPVISQIREIFDTLLPPDERNVSQLRSQIHGLIEMPHHGASRLKERIPRQLGRYDLRAHKVDRLVTREVLRATRRKSGTGCRLSAAMDPGFSKPFPPWFLPSHDPDQLPDPPFFCPGLGPETSA